MNTGFKKVVNIDNDVFLGSQDPVSLSNKIFSILSNSQHVGKVIPNGDLE